MDYTMKTKNIIIIMAFLGMGFCACTDESEELLPLLGAEDVLVNKDNITGLRSIRPMDTNAEGPIITNPGQKGRDHRDGSEYNGLFDLKSKGVMQRTIGSMYIEGYDEKTGEYILNFYWGDPISEETKKNFNNTHLDIIFIDIYDHQPLVPNCNGGGYCWIPSENKFMYGSGYKINFYYLGDPIRIPKQAFYQHELIVTRFCIDQSGNRPIDILQNVDDLFLDTYIK